MKICYLCADPGIPIYGRKGCSTHVRETIKALVDLGHEVKVLCANVAGDHEDGQDLDIQHVPPPRSRKWGFDLRHIILDRRLWRSFCSLSAEWRPDAIYERYSLYSRTGYHAARRLGIPRLLEVNAFLTREQEKRIRVAWLARYCERTIIRHAPRVIVVSEPLRREIHGLGVPMDWISKMPMAVNLDRFNPALDGAPVRARYGLEGRFVIGYVGTLAGWHGIRLLYELAEELHKLNAPPYVFLIVGGDAQKLGQHRQKASQAGLEDVLRFVGSVPHDAVPHYIRAMDLTIVPDTTYWSSPAKLFEYQASGIPVLAPSYPAIHEALEHGREGFIFPPLDIARMAALALEAMNRPELRRQMGEAGRRRAELEHSWSHNGERILELFAELGAHP